ncbi:ribonuclease P protein component [Paenarthrobacter aurescens]|uniref:ribonuclease P protein component n=1 Tax=Paenarthrobacter aurescens TaxID=43663 RepID=UPI0011412D32|nr:ribonuclease P protein component [Paenarthrobacter aurescens]UKA49971.1 ribonuclease P protein component [Arthrobacter sp. FW305-123]MDO6141697.1 ribonuclease P protein component [Paenarthrobacter aurescens]MDO6149460.1 ribonuclease P protein component [Paenarthrobacter aurescens]MDO6156746.1 ribonuclease P protein component [Paenarthrobacter aurescens]MDO6160732.1 ribonuclease P protein component [Paenarthrobacter aurescens]
MLATPNRLRTSTDFSTTVRSGVRNGRRNLVLYTASIGAEEPSRIGFIVSKAVGNAVTRNLVKRRLREAGALSLHTHGTGLAVVVRALPAAATASWEQLLSDYNAALAVTTKRLGGSGPRNASTEHNGTTTEGTPRA